MIGRDFIKSGKTFMKRVLLTIPAFLIVIAMYLAILLGLVRVTLMIGDISSHRAAMLRRDAANWRWELCCCLAELRTRRAWRCGLFRQMELAKLKARKFLRKIKIVNRAKCACRNVSRCGTLASLHISVS